MRRRKLCQRQGAMGLLRNFGWRNPMVDTQGEAKAGDLPVGEWRGRGNGRSWADHGKGLAGWVRRKVGYLLAMAHSKASSRPACSSQHCSDWARIYLKYCLCSAKDGVAIFLGTVSIISWGVAEVPQILTNFREKSTKGLSVAFLMTWVVGFIRDLCFCRDLLNLIGCILEPATLPTQFYVALLYTATTVILTGQTIYYGHTDRRHKSNKNIISSKVRVRENENLLGDAKKSNVGGYKGNTASLSEESNTQSSPIPVTGPSSPSDSNGRNFYFVSARSLSKSPVPIFGTWLAYSHEDGRSHHLNDGHHDQQFAATEPLLSSQSAPTKFSTKNMLSLVPSTGLLICICVYHLCFHDNTEPHGMVVQVGRKLLQNELQGNEASGAGTLLGWMMAAIYVGGRLPQICLNIRRGNVQASFTQTCTWSQSVDVYICIGWKYNLCGKYLQITVHGTAIGLASALGNSWIDNVCVLVTSVTRAKIKPLDCFVAASKAAPPWMSRPSTIGDLAALCYQSLALVWEQARLGDGIWLTSPLGILLSRIPQTNLSFILVKSLAWSAIKPNLPWLVDAGGCAILDAFISFSHADIVVQFVYFRYRQPNKSASDNNQA
ncbi:hypothetical protein ZIOFF_015700 [Zingiber officinale]|uniref:PQ-loop repeat family protein / transmembrane family protein n=1 Tax=Zingiber officinale TaxID=94328 RepID=A0A8J5LFI4_ZINOF|nr:hypothetical protein ZIOFF_015700 [Zingiber officinale]